MTKKDSGRTIDLIDARDLGVDDVESVVTEIFGIEGQLLAKKEFHILCPVHDDRNPSCDVNLTTGFWNCFSCGAGSDLVGLGVRSLKKSRDDVIALLRPNEPDAMAAAVGARARRKLKESRANEERDTFTPEIPPLGSYSPLRGKPLRELRERGFTKKTLKSWGIRYVERAVLKKHPDSVGEGKKDFFEITHAVGIPIVGPSGSVVAWCYRSTAKSEKWFQKTRYLYTPGVNDTLNRIWFGWHRHQNEPWVVVVEGALDAIWCDQNGIPALAMLGTNAKQDAKVDALAHFRRVTLLGDRDEPGTIAVVKLALSLADRGVPCTIALYRKWMRNQKGKRASDPQELCPIDLELSIHTAEPWPIWSRSRPSLIRAVGSPHKGNNRIASIRQPK